MYRPTRLEELRKLNPRQFEMLVAQVYRDLGYEAHVTRYTGDRGLDIILVSPDGEAIGVQCKRCKGRVGSPEILHFVGALHRAGYQRGIFVPVGVRLTVNGGGPKRAWVQ